MEEFIIDSNGMMSGVCTEAEEVNDIEQLADVLSPVLKVLRMWIEDLIQYWVTNAVAL